MKALCAGLCLLLWAVLLCAQVSDELIELNTSALADSSWQAVYDRMGELNQPLTLDSRLYFSDSAEYILNSAIYRLSDASLLLNHKHDWNSDLDLLNFRMGIHTERIEGAVGSYRYRFGSGLVIGNDSRSPSDSLFSLKEPASPATYTPLGAAFKLNFGDWRAALFGSLQKREARVTEGEITSLASTRTGLPTTVRENILAASFGYSSKTMQTGALLYLQNYDKPFADVSLQQNLMAGSVYGSLQLGGHKLDAELALRGEDLFGLAAWRYKLKGFEQTLSYARNGIRKQLPYATTAAVLNTATNRDELSYDLRLPLPLKTSLRLRYSLNSGSAFSGSYLSRLLASLQYADKGNAARFTFYAFDRDIIALVDSTYSSLPGKDFRLQLFGKYHFRPHFYQQLECSYYLENKSDYTQNTFRISLALGYDLDKLHLKAGYLSWQSPRSFLTEDALDPQYYSLCTSDDSALFATLDHQFKRWNVSAAVQKSLLHKEDYRFNLRLGLALL